jgi:molybdopterin-binding protein
MNKLRALIKNQKHAQGLTRIEAMCGEYLFRLLIFEDIETQRVGQEAYLLIKESEIAISTAKLTDISISNRIECEVVIIKMGEILCELEMSFGGQKLYSIITAESTQRLEISAGDKIYALIKANEIYLEGIA